MATTTRPSLNVGLDSSTLSAIKEAGVDVATEGGSTIRKDMAKIDRTAGVGAAVGVASAGVQAYLATKEKEAQENQALLDEAEVLWDNGLSSIESRGQWDTPDMYDQFFEAENAYKQTYLDHIREGRTKEAAKMLQEQKTRANELNGMRTTMKSAVEIQNDKGGGWSNKIKNDPESLEIVGSVANIHKDANGNPNVVTRYDSETNEMVFDIYETKPTGEVDEKGQPIKEVVIGENGEPVVKYTKTRRDIDGLVASGIAPSELRDSENKALTDLSNSAYKGDLEPNWGSRENMVAQNMKEADISHYIHENIYVDKDGAQITFKSHFMADENPAWSQPINITTENSTLDDLEELVGDGNDTIEENEWELILNPQPPADTSDADAMAKYDQAVLLAKDARELIIEEMEKQPDVARRYLAQWKIGIEKQAWQRGLDAKANKETNEETIDTSQITITEET